MNRSDLKRLKKAVNTLTDLYHTDMVGGDQLLQAWALLDPVFEANQLNAAASESPLFTVFQPGGHCVTRTPHYKIEARHGAPARTRDRRSADDLFVVDFRLAMETPAKKAA